MAQLPERAGLRGTARVGRARGRGEAGRKLKTSAAVSSLPPWLERCGLSAGRRGADRSTTERARQLCLFLRLLRPLRGSLLPFAFGAQSVFFSFWLRNP